MKRVSNRRIRSRRLAHQSSISAIIHLIKGNKIVTIIVGMIELRGYIDERGHKRFALWLESLDAAAAAKVAIAPDAHGTGKSVKRKRRWRGRV